MLSVTCASIRPTCNLNPELLWLTVKTYILSLASFVPNTASNRKLGMGMRLGFSNLQLHPISSPIPSLSSLHLPPLSLGPPFSQADRRHHSRVHELQERLDQANSTKRSMENYVNFLKSSYASIFNDSGNPTSPHSTLLH